MISYRSFPGPRGHRLQDAAIGCRRRTFVRWYRENHLQTLTFGRIGERLARLVCLYFPAHVLSTNAQPCMYSSTHSPQCEHVHPTAVPQQSRSLPFIVRSTLSTLRLLYPDVDWSHIHFGHTSYVPPSAVTAIGVPAALAAPWTAVAFPEQLPQRE